MAAHTLYPLHGAVGPTGHCHQPPEMQVVTGLSKRTRLKVFFKVALPASCSAVLMSPSVGLFPRLSSLPLSTSPPPYLIAFVLTLNAFQDFLCAYLYVLPIKLCLLQRESGCRPCVFRLTLSTYPVGTGLN